ncbi:AraC family transcriptional regulator [Streptomyces sp. SID11385]|nr:AraC family transcriptional regulator [Streptomyces sp. SID11385]
MPDDAVREGAAAPSPSEAALHRLTAAVARHAPEGGTETAVPRLSLAVTEEPVGPVDLLYEPMICFVSAGAKRSTAGERTRIARAGEMLLNSIDLPVSVSVVEAPYSSVTLRVDERLLADLLVEVEESAGVPLAPAGQLTAPMAPELVDAVTRFVTLLDSPEDIRALAPRVEGEILYRLLRGPLGPVLRAGALADSPTQRVRRAARWICERYAEPLGIDAIAAVARMSPAGLHRHFKAATGMSPLRYQKYVRLQAARRRLAAGDATAAQVAREVGYVSATQFSREYRTAFGLPPARDAARLRGTGSPS